jgi:putative transposase
MTLYKNKYRIESARCQTWDYTSNGYYFITICTHNKQSFFGEIINAEIKLSKIGEIVAEEWQKTEQIRPNIQLDAWVIMPNHMHSILIINNPVETTHRVISDITINQNASTNENNTNTKKIPRSQSNSLGSIVGQFKSVCTKQIWMAGFTEFKWQARFHDRIIHDQESLNHTRKYIINNPAKWKLDEHNLVNPQ